MHVLPEHVSRELERVMEVVGLQPRTESGIRQSRGERIGQDGRGRVLVFECEERRGGVFVKKPRSGVVET